jgi:hypothetical protein
MPLMDVSEALNNPYTLDYFDVIRRAQLVNTSGEVGIPQPQIFSQVAGVVAPDNAPRLQRNPEAQIAGKILLVYTTFALRGQTQDGVPQDYQPDLVIWGGNQFIVVSVDDYSRYGTGFVKAVCDMMDMNAMPEVTQ